MQPMLFANVSDRPTVNFSRRIRYVASLRGRACALKNSFDAKSKELFFSRGSAHAKINIYIVDLFSNSTQILECIHQDNKTVLGDCVCCTV